MNITLFGTGVTCLVNIQKNILLFLFIVVQTTIAVFSGLAVLFLSAGDTIAPNVLIGDIHVGELSRDEASTKLDRHYEECMKNGALTIKYNGDVDFRILYSDVDAWLDSEASIEQAYGKGKLERLFNLLQGFFSLKAREYDIVLSFNEGKLRQKIAELAQKVDREPRNAYISIENGKVIKNQEETGVKINIENAVNKIKAETVKQLNSYITFSLDNNYEIQEINPQVTVASLEGVDEIISEYSTRITSGENKEYIRFAAEAINNVMIKPSDIKTGEKDGMFSFSKCLDEKGGLLEESNEGYDQVASTLYAAVLTAGIDQRGIVRTPHKETVDYILPGLDAKILGKTIDFSFANTLDSMVVILAGINEDKLIVRLVGKKNDKELNSALKTEIIQKFSPSVVNMENQMLPRGERRLIDPGREGVKVGVYRITIKNGTELTKKFLYCDKYDAVKAIVEIGPDTKWDTNGTIGAK